MKNEYDSIKEVADKFWELEKRHDLNNFEISGIHVWQLIRYDLFASITEDIFDLGASQAVSSTFSKIKQFPLMLYHAIFNNGWFLGKYETLVFPHTRVVRVEGEYVDPYTKYFVDGLVEKNCDFIVMEKPFNQKHFCKKRKYVKFLDDAILFIFFAAKFIPVNIRHQEDFIQNLRDEIKLTFDVDIDLKQLLLNKVKKFRVYYYYYSKLLNRIKPKRIYLVASYCEQWLVKAAKDLGIRVIEFQHGAYSKYHLGYSYQKGYKIQYLPDDFLVWNQYWKELVPFPSDAVNVQIYPFEFQRLEMQKYKDVEKVKNQVIVLSQGTVSNKIAKVILDNFEFFEDKTIKYKLHPGERQRYRTYNFLMELLKKDNVELVVQGDLYLLLASSDFQVAVYSTAVYEGLEFGLKTILCDLPNVEFMQSLVELGRVERVFREIPSRQYPSCQYTDR